MCITNRLHFQGHQTGVVEPFFILLVLYYMFLLCCFAYRFVDCIYRTVVVVIVWLSLPWIKIENTPHLNRSTLAPVVLGYMLTVYYMLFSYQTGYIM
jgi:hypothetical protein